RRSFLWRSSDHRGVDALGGTISEPAWRSKPSWYLAALEKVARPIAALEHLHRVLDLDMGREKDDAGPRKLRADLAGGVEALCRVVRRHADVDNRQLGPLLADQADQLGAVIRLSDDFEAGVLQQARQALTEEDVVIRQDYATPLLRLVHQQRLSTSHSHAAVRSPAGRWGRAAV